MDKIQILLIDTCDTQDPPGKKKEGYNPPKYVLDSAQRSHEIL